MNIVLSGSIAFDYLMTFPGYFSDHFLPDHLEHISLSFLVDSMVRQRGGVAPNIAYTLALLGEHPRLMGTVGEDFAEYHQALESVGVDLSAVRVIPGEYTASFFANTDRSNAQIASFYPGAMRHAGDLSLYQLKDPRPDLVVISPNDPRAMIRHVTECQEMQIPYLYDPSQQLPRLQDSELRLGVERAWALFVNDYEFGLIQKKTKLAAREVFEKTQFTVVTYGEQGSIIYTRLGESGTGSSIHIPVVKPQQITDPTGVGDAFRGGFLAGYSHGLEWVTCGRMGALAATYCLEQQGPQGHTYTPAEFITRFRENFDDGGKLDQLMGD